MVNLFVYGTLKKGHRNHHVLGPDARFLCNATVYNMTMHKGPGFPYAVFKDNSEIKGEVYELPNLAACDRLEGYPHHYLRTEVICWDDDESDDENHDTAWVYHAGPSVNLDWYPETTEEWTHED
jgi:gamma-glutamylcyclotransferase (GGCT)/AIG2-like uncharacterized protein YtfP